MKIRTLFQLFILFIAGSSFAACHEIQKPLPAYDKGINVTPTPAEMTVINDTVGYTLNPSTQIVVPAGMDSLKETVTFIAEKMRRSTGLKLNVIDSNKTKNVIAVSVDKNLMPDHKEGYTLVSNKDGVNIVGASIQGAYYGMQTLLQLLPAEIESSKKVNGFTWLIPSVEIKDYPRFEYRGILLDVCRHFLSVEEMKKEIDVLSMLKINKLHWHLTEDQAWRIEIKKYPRLTELGSTRKLGDGTNYGPYFYTQDEVKDIVAYAQKHFIEIIPEIELPGHSMAALTAYPNLACFPRDFEVRRIWGVEDDVYCAGKDSVFTFLQDVINEVMPLFPSQYFHIGGDECPKKMWKQCPLCQKRMRENGLKNEHELQSYFISRMGDYLQKHGKKMIGWDEILEGGLAPSAIVMSWRGEEGGIQAANMNHNVIMTPSNQGLYIDHFQGDSKVEPTAIGGYAPIRKTYSYNPLPNALPTEKHHYILGAQANLWAEYLYTPEQSEYMAWPRMVALAELTWSPLEKKNFEDFCRRLDNEYVRLDEHHIYYHIPIPEQANGSLNHIEFMDSITIPFTTTRPIKMVYTSDGTEPNPDSPEYKMPLHFDKSTTLKIASVLPSGKLSKVRTIELKKVTTYAPSSVVEKTKLKKGFQSLFISEVLPIDTDMEQYCGKDNAKESILHSQKDLGQSLYKKNTKEYNEYTALYNGYIDVPEDNVYVLSTRADRLWLDNKLLIDNGKQLTRDSHNDHAVALSKGLHKFRLLIRGRIDGGFPTVWLDNRILIKAYGASKFSPVPDDAFFYEQK